jgi:hypothetical protein
MSSYVSHLSSAPLPDVCRNKHGGNDESELANARVHSSKEADKKRVKDLAEARGDYGVTVHEVERALGMKIQTASARMADLKADGEIVWNGQRRGNAKAFVVPKGQLSLI